ncbi:baseplate wedge [Xanthomonas phage XacN1]|nr:baseplate wedge [Xanthomonas phage XacN1]
MANENLYRGLSFRNFSKNKSIKLYDVELIKKDLLNHIFTRRGERVKMFTYGTRIPDLVFEQLDDIALTVVTEDLNAVVASEPRVSLVDLRIVPLYDRNVIIASLVLYYVELDFTDQFDVSIQFES